MSRPGHLTEDDLVAYHYAESDDKAGDARHLMSCAACRSEYDALAQTLSIVSDAEIPDRSGDYGAQVWMRLEPKLAGDADATAQGPALDRSSFFRPGRLAVAASLMVMLLAGFLAGRFWPRPGPEVLAVGPISAEARERILMVAIGDHLERSQRMLVGFANSGPGDQAIAARRQEADALIEAGRIYRQSVSGIDPALAGVLEELERVLLDVAHAPDEAGAAEWTSLQERVRSGGILFKVRVLGSHIRERSQAPGAASART
ncbi:MAG TPA: hypothetical protein VFP98_00260 [Candidatus Polarisedimenticolia bacterium]|nr:hypothetical protein [Candidatus Polarisedimenticolia bacterium]